MSRLEHKEITIGDHTYQMGYWAPDDALARLTRLIKLVGEPVAKVLIGVSSSEGSKGLDTEINEAQVIGDAISGLAMRLNEADVKKLFRECQDQLLCDNQQIEYVNHYRGRPGHLVKVTLQQLRHQYSDFLELLPANGGLSSMVGTATQQQASL